MNVLLAEESLREVERTVIGTGNLKKSEAGRIIRDWQRVVRRAHAAAEKRHVVNKETRRQLFNALGVKTVKVARTDG
jgi:hypothetical protein